MHPLVSGSLAILFFIATTVFSSSSIFAATIPLTGKAQVLNTANSYLDFTNYGSNVTVDSVSGVFNGYGFLEDLGWVSFGASDNATGPVSYDVTTGEVNGKAKVLSTDSLIDFDASNSNVRVDITTGVFTGYVFSTDIGWLNFSDPGVRTTSTSLDSTPPVSFRLESPGHQSYTKDDRPDFKWQPATDQMGTISKYVFEVDNGQTGDFSVDNIPTYSATDIVTPKYTIRYEGFSDSDTTNNFIHIQTHASSEWGDNQNNGALNEGKRTWTVKAYDSNGNYRSETRTLFVDYSHPNVMVSQFNTVTSTTNAYATTDPTPTISGRIIDSLYGDSEVNAVASGPHAFEIKIEQKNAWGEYTLHSTVNSEFTDIYWSSDNSIVTQRSDNTSDKYAPFTFTPSNALQIGTYRVTITGKDGVGLERTTTIFITINQSTYVPIIQEKPADVTTQTTPPRETISERNQKTPTPIAIATPMPSDNPGPNIGERLSNLFNIPRAWLGRVTPIMIAYWRIPIRRDITLANNILAYLSNVGQATNQMIAGILKTPRMIAQRMQTWVAYSIGSFSEIVLNQEPTRITDVTIVEVGSSYAIVEWKTNHYTKNNKINWGETTEYGNHAFAEDFTKEHLVKIEGLTPGVAYKFEVMSQNRNYVYDSFHEFVTKPE